ncbi:ESPR-type extended signal peptide-containing protein [Escherichia coli]|uniref:two-partner secretion domain-containing protein n=1 Tax=Escherichia coli TaxID=562 RepID=UPI000F0B32AD|nr:ESPR-type extended signal peptide-containing protein [Escherichia coli]
MNHIYKLKFDKRRREMVVVSEITSGVGKARSGGTGDVRGPLRRGRTLALSLLSGLVMMANPALAAGLPVGGQIVGGTGSIQTPSGSQMNVHQNSQNLIVNWQSFDIGKGNTVQFYQPDSSAVALNRVTGGSASEIMGNLKANGQVFLVNPNGVLFGKGSSVNTAGFVATTRDIKNDDFMNRRYTFSGEGKAGAEIVSQGNLTTAAGGYIVLAADKVSNSGTIRTPGGKTVLAAGKRVTLQLDNAGLTSVQVSGEVVNALVENRGLVSAADGQVYLTALGKNMLLNTVLNVSGVVEAGGMRRQDGNIVLNGGNSGVVHLSGKLSADNASGRGGKVVVQGQNILLGKGSRITATGAQGGGDVYVGGGWQGKDTSIRNADKVVMQQGAQINASATTRGDGGTVVLWSESFTNFRGSITAKGGASAGNGGQVETSSHGNLQAFGSVDASAPRGKAGNWLLDPLDITVVDGSSSGNVTKTEDSATNNTSFSPSAQGSQVSNTSINNELNNGTSVTILTNSTTAGGNQSGNITVNADINKTNGGDASLTLKADGNITINNHNITSTAGKLNITLLGAGSNTGMIKVTNSTLSSNGGNITLDRMDTGSANAMSVKVSNSTLNATNGSDKGNITIKAYNPNINLSQSAFNNTVRNSGALLEISGNSTLNGNNILLESNQTGANSRNLPIYLNGTNITAEGNITLNAMSSGSSQAAQVEIRGANNILSSNNGNITISHNMSGSNSGSNAIFLNGTTASNVMLNATNGSITIEGKAHNGNGTVITNTNLRANSAVINGSTNASMYALNLTNLNLSGNLASWSNITLSSAGSAGGASNAINAGVIKTEEELKKLLKAGIENNTMVNVSSINTTGGGQYSINLSNMAGWGIGSGNRNNSGDLTLNLSSDKGGNWGFSNVSALYTSGNVSISGLLLSNLNITGGNLSFTNVSGTTTNATLNATTGNINITSSTNGGMALNKSNLTANKDVTLNGSYVHLSGTNISSSAGNINITGKNKSNVVGVLLHNTTLNASQGNIAVDAQSATYIDSFYGANSGALVFRGNTSLSAEHIYVNGTNVNQKADSAIGNTVGIGFVRGGRYSFFGNVSMNATAKINALYFIGGGGVSFLNFHNGTVLINASSMTGSGRYNNVIGYDGAVGASTTNVTINLTNSDLTFNLKGNGNSFGALGTSITPYLNITGTGNVAINGNSTTGGNGIGGVILNISTVNGSVNLNGTSNTGAGVNLGGASNLSGANVTINGNSNTGNGIILNGNADATNATINGSSNTGTGTSIQGSANISGSNITGTSNGSGNGIFIGNGTASNGSGANLSLNGSSVNSTGIFIGNGDRENLNATGSSTNGAGVNITGNVTNGTITGTTVNGTGALTSGTLINTTVNGNATGNGSGVNVSGNITNGTITGNASGNGSGVGITGNTTLNNVTVNGSTANGSGVNISGNLSNSNGSTVTGNATGDGNGVNISGNVTDGNISGNATGNGSGVDITGNSTLNNTTINGSASGNGSGVATGGNTTTNGSTITGNATNGSGVQVGGNLTNTNTTITGNSTGSNSGVDINGTVTGGTITGGNTGDGNGVNISGNVTDGNISGNATGNGSGVDITGNSTLNNTTVNGSSVNGSGIRVTEPVTLTNSTLTGSSTNGLDMEHVSPTHSGLEAGWQQQDAGLHGGLLTGSDAVQASGYRTEVEHLNVSVCMDDEGCENGPVVSSRAEGVMPPQQGVEVVRPENP